MPRCVAYKVNDEPCQAWAVQGSDRCFIHDPARGAERAAARRLGGLRRRAGHGGDLAGLPSQVRTMGDVLAVLDYALGEITYLENSVSRARALVSLASAYTDAIKTGEFEQRLQALEAHYANNR